ncbi:MAG: phosphomannomutase/phosphoglucomutase [Rhodospirillaceae bacterium]
MRTHLFDSSILREYDIRGIVGKTLSALDAHAIGRAFGSVVVRMGGKTVCVGYDGRHSSPPFECAVVEGLLASGLKVFRMGLGSTPMLYFGVNNLPADAGIMVSGSHNPPEYNGFKMMLGRAPFFGSDIKRLGEIAAQADWTAGRGSCEDVDILEPYVSRMARDYVSRNGLKVAWDAGNGSAGPAMVRLTEKLPGSHELINEKVDGNFPNHHPDPTVPECLEQLKDVVVQSGSDIGLAFDGDGDRIGALDEKGRILWGDQLMILLAADVLKSHPNATIIADVKASQVLFDEIKRMGGRPMIWRTGHSLIKARMAEVGSPLAGEMSGHIFFADKWYGFDDGLYAAVRLLNYLAELKNPLSEIRDSFPKVFNTPELRFRCNDERKIEVVSEVSNRVKLTEENIVDVDGIRVQTEDGWWLLRASNTEDVLVARCEADSEDGLERVYQALGEQLSKSHIDFPSK